jgi:UDPglucose 6-dehydrogenase
MMRITVIGCGYLGATHAACMAELGHDVLGVEADPAKRTMLRDGRAPIYEPRLDDLLSGHVGTGRLRFSHSYADAAAFADLHFLCVGTPQAADGLGADLRDVYAVVEALAPSLSAEAVIVGKSTVPVGTAAHLARRITELTSSVELAWNPEFLREGRAVEDTLSPDRIVLGVESTDAEKAVRECYTPILEKGVPVVVTDFATAELAKVAANAFLATKISFINAIADVCDAAGADVVDLATAMGHDPRIGREFLDAGIGFGGGCLPKDIRALVHRADELGVHDAVAFLSEVDDLNLRRREQAVAAATTMLHNQVAGSKVAVWGAAFKPGSDDVRDSPALSIAEMLARLGAKITIFDPQANENARRRFPDLGYADSAVAAAQDADLILHLTEWPEFRSLNPADIATVVNRLLILDGRNCLDVVGWQAAGWTVRGFGWPRASR